MVGWCSMGTFNDPCIYYHNYYCYRYYDDDGDDGDGWFESLLSNEYHKGQKRHGAIIRFDEEFPCFYHSISW